MFTFQGHFNVGKESDPVTKEGEDVLPSSSEGAYLLDGARQQHSLCLQPVKTLMKEDSRTAAESGEGDGTNMLEVRERILRGFTAMCAFL